VGKDGKAISLVCEAYVHALESIEKYLGMKIPVIWPDESLFAKDKSPRSPHFRGSQKKHGFKGRRSTSAPRHAHHHR
jgi:ATP-dependent RNA helicase RhlB